MRAESHIRLGKYLAENHMHSASQLQIRFFLLGCIQPDRNPATYLKGSLHHRWLRGHNYRNASRFMYRISRRLERKTRFRLQDYYTLGKLIHYTADAFTRVHNDPAPTGLGAHMEYEDTLQRYFLPYLAGDPEVEVSVCGSIMETVCACHSRYRTQNPDVSTDARFALAACCAVMTILFPAATPPHRRKEISRL